MTTQAVPPKIKSAPSLGFFAVIVLGAAFLVVATVVFFFNPSRYGFYPICLFHQLTGLNCPGCGATRSFCALLHGHFQQAVKDNALFVFSLAATAIRGAWVVQQKFSGKMVGQFFPTKWLWPVLIVAIVFAVLRNLPEFSFLSP